MGDVADLGQQGFGLPLPAKQVADSDQMASNKSHLSPGRNRACRAPADRSRLLCHSNQFLIISV